MCTAVRARLNMILLVFCQSNIFTSDRLRTAERHSGRGEMSQQVNLILLILFGGFHVRSTRHRIVLFTVQHLIPIYGTRQIYCEPILK